jgi:pyruvate/2-oxoglutarate dehydrogenase complex dihydrolipoamide acyltransferase (E2) component
MRVAKGDKLAALEAMKMETVIIAPHDGTVAEVYTAPGAQVAAGQVMLALIPDRAGGGAPGALGPGAPGRGAPGQGAPGQAAAR